MLACACLGQRFCPPFPLEAKAIEVKDQTELTSEPTTLTSLREISAFRVNTYDTVRPKQPTSLDRFNRI
jgi:hypothetical protein